MHTRITFLCVILVCNKFRLFLVDFPKSNSRLRKTILVDTRIIVFSQSCEKSNSRIYENFIFEGRNIQFSWVSFSRRIIRELYFLGKPCITKMDKFSEKFRTAFDPPLLFGKSYCNFFQNSLPKYCF